MFRSRYVTEFPIFLLYKKIGGYVFLFHLHVECINSQEIFIGYIYIYDEGDLEYKTSYIGCNLLSHVGFYFYLWNCSSTVPTTNK